MKNKPRFNILTSLITALFILSLFSGIASAQTPIENYEKDYQVYKNNYDNTKKKFDEAKDIFDKANGQFKDAKDVKSKEELMQRTKDYLLGAIDHTVAHLEVLKFRVERSENDVIPFDATKIINDHLTQLEKLRIKVKDATTALELKDANKELKDLWIKIRLETRYYMGIVLNHKINNFISRADSVTAKVDAAIDKVKASGKDTKKLEGYAADFRNAVSDAKNAHNKNKELFSKHGGFNTDGTVSDNKAAAEFLRQTNDLQKDTIRKLKEASKRLIDFVREFKKLAGGNVRVSQKGDLETNGGAAGTPVGTSASTPTATATAATTAAPNITSTPVSTSTPNSTATPVTTATPNSTSTPVVNATGNSSQ